MTSVPTVINLDQFHTNDVLKMDVRGAGTYKAKMAIRGNSLLSSVYIKSIDPGVTLKVNYYDTTTGTDGTSERFDLVSHDLLTDANAGETVRITVPRIHNKPQVEAIVTGGNVEFGVYITVVSTLVSDLDLALVRDGDTFFPLINKGMPTVCLDRDTGLLHFLTCQDGAISVTTAEQGEPYFISGNVNSDPGVEVTLFSFTVPIATTRKIKSLDVISEAPGLFYLESGGSEIAAGIIFEARKNISLKFDPARPISAGTLVELKYLADASFDYACPVRGFLSALDIT